jgi:hypothetical protein
MYQAFSPKLFGNEVCTSSQSAVMARYLSSSASKGSAEFKGAGFCSAESWSLCLVAQLSCISGTMVCSGPAWKWLEMVFWAADGMWKLRPKVARGRVEESEFLKAKVCKSGRGVFVRVSSEKPSAHLKSLFRIGRVLAIPACWRGNHYQKGSVEHFFGGPNPDR